MHQGAHRTAGSGDAWLQDNVQAASAVMHRQLASPPATQHGLHLQQLQQQQRQEHEAASSVAAVVGGGVGIRAYGSPAVRSSPAGSPALGPAGIPLEIHQQQHQMNLRQHEQQLSYQQQQVLAAIQNPQNLQQQQQQQQQQRLPLTEPQAAEYRNRLAEHNRNLQHAAAFQQQQQQLRSASVSSANQLQQHAVMAIPASGASPQPMPGSIAAVSALLGSQPPSATNTKGGSETHGDSGPNASLSSEQVAAEQRRVRQQAATFQASDLIKAHGHMQQLNNERRLLQKLRQSGSCICSASCEGSGSMGNVCDIWRSSLKWQFVADMQHLWQPVP